MTPEDNRRLREYCQTIIGKPRPLEAQPHVRAGVWLWCEDWELIEVLKCLFLGVATYRAEPPPRRLHGNPLWSPEQIIATAEALQAAHPSAEAIIHQLQERRDAVPHEHTSWLA